MTPDQILVTVGGLAGAATVARFFWFQRSEGVRAATMTDGYLEQRVLVKGGYTPDTIRVTAGRSVRLLFRREATAACSKQVVLPDFDPSAALPAGRVVPVEFLPTEPGEHGLSCAMGMLRGRVLVEAA